MTGRDDDAASRERSERGATAAVLDAGACGSYSSRHGAAVLRCLWGSGRRLVHVLRFQSQARRARVPPAENVRMIVSLVRITAPRLQYRPAIKSRVRTIENIFIRTYEGPRLQQAFYGYYFKLLPTIV